MYRYGIFLKVFLDNTDRVDNKELHIFTNKFFLVLPKEIYWITSSVDLTILQLSDITNLKQAKILLEKVRRSMNNYNLNKYTIYDIYNMSIAKNRVEWFAHMLATELVHCSNSTTELPMLHMAKMQFEFEILKYNMITKKTYFV